MAKAKRRRKAVPVSRHESYRKKGRLRCKHCGGKHSASQHWSHRASEAKKSYKTDPARKHAPGDFRAGARRVKSGLSKKSRKTSKASPTRAERRAMNKARHQKAQMSKHAVRGHLAKNPKSSGQHRVKRHTAKNPKRGGGRRKK